MTVFTILAIFVIALHAAIALRLGANLLIRDIKGPAFGAQIMKLVMANSIDKAIKLCNVAPEAPMARAAKAILTQANRPYSIELQYRAGDATLRLIIEKVRNWIVVPQLGTAGLAIITLFMGPGHQENPAFLLIVVGLFGVCLYLWSKLDSSFRIQQVWLRKIRDTVLHRAEYVPPVYRVQKATPDDLQAWQDSMDKFEASVAERKEAGETFDTNDEYDRQARPDGVLPPL